MVESIKEGFRVINRNLPLVIIQIVMMIISFLAFIIFIGVPVAIGVIYLGIDPVRFKEVLSSMKDPSGFLNQYAGLVVFVVVVFLLYITAITGLAIFVFGGNLAIIKDSIKEPLEKFSYKKFMMAGKKYFSPLCWLSLILSLFFILFVFLLGALVGAGIVFLTPYKEEMGTFLIVLAVISGMMTLLLAFIGFFLILTLSIYAVISLVAEDLRAWNAIKRSAAFIKNKLFEATGFYLLLISGYIGAILLMMIVTFPFNMIPFVGPIISIPFQFVTYIIQVYLGLVMMASLMVFYIRKA